jgi:DNA-binding IclR family transcriptional regulator
MFSYGVGATKSGVQAAIHAPWAALQAAAAAIVDVGVAVNHAHHPTGPVAAAAAVVAPNFRPAKA